MRKNQHFPVMSDEALFIAKMQLYHTEKMVYYSFTDWYVNKYISILNF